MTSKLLIPFLFVFGLMATPLQGQTISQEIRESLADLSSLDEDDERKKAVIDSLAIAARENGTKAEALLVGLELADWHFDNKHLPEALDQYRTVLKDVPSGGDSVFLQRTGQGYMELANIYNMRQLPDSALFVLKRALRQYERSGYLRGVAMTYSYMAGMYQNSGLSDSTLIFLAKGLELTRETNDSVGVGNFLVGLGTTQMDMGNYRLAIGYFMEAQEISQALKDDFLYSQVLSNLASYYLFIKDLDRAKTYGLKFLALTDTVELGYGNASAALTMGSYYDMVDRHDSAFFYLERSIAQFEQAGYMLGKLRAMTKKADLYVETDRLAEAQLLYEEVLRTSSGRTPSLNARCLHGIARINIKQENYPPAVILLDSALASADFEKIGIYQLNQMYRSLHLSYKAMGNYKEALNYLEKVVTTKDSLITKEKQMDIARIEYEGQLKNEKAVFDLKEKNQELEYQAKLEASRMVRNLMIVASVLGTALLLVIVRSYRRTQKDNTLLAEQALELKQKNEELADLNHKEQALLKDNIEEKERRMVAITMMEHEKHGVLQKIDERLQVLTKKSSDIEAAELRGIRNLVKTNLDMESSWDSFVHQFDQINPTFFTQLRERFPGITTNDLKTCAYIKVGMDNKGIAQVTNASPNTIKSRIHRLKKKMNLAPEDSIRALLVNMD